jgi:hypothetical protein
MAEDREEDRDAREGDGNDRDARDGNERDSDGEEGDELRDDEHALLMRWQPPGPPAGFAARVLGMESQADATSAAAEGAEAETSAAATTTTARPARASRSASASSSDPSRSASSASASLAASSAARRLRAITWGAVALAAAIAAALTLSLRSSGAPDSRDHPARPPEAALSAPMRSFPARESLALGGRGIAVAEAGAALGWRRIGGAARVEQEAGDVFYRVDPGGPFTVVTAAGEIRVTGTCFRVEVISMKPLKQGLLGAAAGAALATAVVVTVYEGKVVVASPSGNAQVRAGERATLTPDSPPALGTSATPTAAVALAELPPAPPNATREELMARDEAMRQQVATLAQRVRQLQTVASAAPPPSKTRGPGDENWMDVSPEQLLDFARECRVQLDYPPLMRGPAPKMDPRLAEELELSSEEVATINQSFVELQADWVRRVRALYLETTSDTAGADSLSPQAMSEELQEKAAAAGEADALQKRIAEERAGLVPVPTDLSRTSPYERYFRGLANLGDDSEAWIAKKLGKEKAHAVRAHNGGWPMRMGLAGCRADAKASEPTSD